MKDGVPVKHVISFNVLNLVSEHGIRPGTWPDASALGFRGDGDLPVPVANKVKRDADSNRGNCGRIEGHILFVSAL
jgi:hypothetical protein